MQPYGLIPPHYHPTQPPPTHTRPHKPQQQLLELCRKLLKSGGWEFDEVLLLHDEAGTGLISQSIGRVVYVYI